MNMLPETPQNAPWRLALKGLALAGLALGVLMPAPTAASEPAAAGKSAPKTVAVRTQAAEPAPASPSAAEAGRADSAKASVAELDPLAGLRERLAGRLAAVKAAEAPSATRPSASLTPSAAKPSTSTAKAATPAAVASKAKPGAPAADVWSYSGEVGPGAWGGLRADYALCGNGQRQSPIDIRDGFAVDLEPIRFSYKPAEFAVIDNGHTVQVNLAPGNSIELAGRRLELVQFHFHRPSEERIDGRQFEMAVHLVHKDGEDRMAVVAVLLERGAAQSVVQAVWNNLPLERRVEQKARASIDVGQLLPSDRRYYTYMGSLTTPPCAEGVQWVVMRHPVAVSPDQIEIFSRLYPMNARPIQAASGRRIMQSD